MKGLFALCWGGLLLAAPPALPPVHTPNLKEWRLELSPDLGGWHSEGRQELSIKLVDPKDPAPPKQERHSYQEDEGPGEMEEGESPSQAQEPAALKQERESWEEFRRRNAWRNRRILLWFNGQASILEVQVGQALNHTLNAQGGENRLELLEPDSGLRLVRTWWASASRNRLSIRRIWAQGDDWGGGNLEVMEPNGELARPGRRTPSGGLLNWDSGYLHATPPAGTYTLRWSGGYRGGKPFKVVVEANLDAGTDRERRLRFERLILPGAGPSTLGTLDVED